MAVDFANVNISLAEFQGISSGKYNAGEVKLASETKLGKVNNHVHFQGSNATPLSHEEVLAVKNAFVKALSSNGVAADEIARIRRELGLSAETGIDKTLHARSIRPLTRQQVRDILDRNAAAINAHADQNPGAARISTSAQIYGEGGMRADRAATRNEVNAALAGAGGTEEHEGIALAEAVISGDVDFCFDKDTKYLLAQAHAQIGQILQRSNGRPSAEREAVIEFHLNKTGQLVSIRTGQSEAAFVRKLEEMVIRLANGRPRDPRGAAVRAEFGALATAQARLDWINGLGNAPDAGFKIRTAVIMMLTEGGIDDWETLSRINRVDDGIARDFARSLAHATTRPCSRSRTWRRAKAPSTSRRTGAPSSPRHRLSSGTEASATPSAPVTRSGSRTTSRRCWTKPPGTCADSSARTPSTCTRRASGSSRRACSRSSRITWWSPPRRKTSGPPFSPTRRNGGPKPMPARLSAARWSPRAAAPVPRASFGATGAGRVRSSGSG